MARKKRSKKGCGCPAGSTKKSIKRVGPRCVKKLATGKWKFVKSNCSR